MQVAFSRRRARWWFFAGAFAVPALTCALGSHGLIGQSVATACTGMPRSNLVPPAAPASAATKPVEVPSNVHLFAIGGVDMFDSVPYPEAPTLERGGRPVATKARLVGVAAAEVVPAAPLEVGALYTFKVFSSESTFKVRAGADTTRPRFSVKGPVVVHEPPRGVPRSSCDPGTTLSLEVELTDDSPAMLFVWVGDAAHPPKLDGAPDSAAMPEIRDGKSTIRFRPSRTCPDCKGAPVVGLLAMDVAGNLSDEAWITTKKKVPSSETFLAKSLPAFTAKPTDGAPTADSSADAGAIDGGPEGQGAHAADASADPSPDASVAAASPAPPSSPPRGCGGCSASPESPKSGAFGPLALVLGALLALRRRNATEPR
jgi:MYXO-CTERM domain-containing protein